MLNLGIGTRLFLVVVASYMIVASFAPCYPFIEVNFISGLLFSILWFYVSMSICGTCTIEEEYEDEEQLLADYKNSLKD